MRLGDRVKRVTEMLGIPTCDGCERRRQWLNELSEKFGNKGIQMSNGPRDQIEKQEVIEGVLEDTEEDRAKAIRQRAEDKVRFALGLPKDAELLDHQKQLADQYERMEKGESLTPKPKVIQTKEGETSVINVVSGNKFKIDPSGREPK